MPRIKSMTEHLSKIDEPNAERVPAGPEVESAPKPEQQAPRKRRRVKPSILIAVLLAVGATGWILSGSFPLQEQAQHQQGAVATEGAAGPGVLAGVTPPEKKAQSVRVYESVAQIRRTTLRIAGRTEASREGRLMAETEGAIKTLDVEEGDTVAAGQRIGSIKEDERNAVVREAEALLTQREIEYSAAVKLASKGFQTEISKATALAEMEAAKAALDRARIDLAKTRLSIPFDGVIWTKNVEQGDLVKVGDLIATIVDLDPLLVVANVSEREVAAVTEGALARAKLITGETVEGIVSYISPQAETATRTFRVEVEVPDTGNRYKAGITAELLLPLTESEAHLISPALLTLDDSGRVGVKLVDEGDIARFAPVQILEDTPDGVWIQGLPRRATLISVGQEYAGDGEKVSPVPDTVFVPGTNSRS
jgi:multidrug efflux system membrane fusion protein